jgi:hypothetical protein
VRGHHHLRAAEHEGLQRRQRGLDPAVVGDHAAVEWNVEVGTDQHGAAGNAGGQQIVEGLHAKLLGG